MYVLVGDDNASTSATPVSLLSGGSSANSGSSDSSMHGPGSHQSAPHRILRFSGLISQRLSFFLSFLSVLFFVSLFSEQLCNSLFAYGTSVALLHSG